MNDFKERLNSSDEETVLAALADLALTLIHEGIVPEVPRFHVSDLPLNRTAEQVRDASAQQRRNGQYPSNVVRADEWLTEVLLRGWFDPPLTWEEKAHELLDIILRFSSTYAAHVGTASVRNKPEVASAFTTEWMAQLAKLPSGIQRPDAQMAVSEALSKLLQTDQNAQERILTAMAAWPDNATLLRIALHAISPLPLPLKEPLIQKARGFPSLHNTLAEKIDEWKLFKEVSPDEKRWLEDIRLSLDPQFVRKPEPITQARFGKLADT